MIQANCDVNERGHLAFSGVDTIELAKVHGTPLYVVSEDAIREKCRRFKNALAKAHPDSDVLYASKAFSNMAMYRVLTEEGLGIDVVSSGELYTAIQSGFPAERIYFHGNNKTPDELEYAISNGIGCIVVDNFHEIVNLERLTAGLDKRVKVLARLSPGVAGATHDAISTGQLDSKFGFPIQGGVAAEAVRRLCTVPGLDFHGIHCHIGSQILEAAPYETAVEVMVAFMKDMRDKHGIVMRELNMGGGFGISYRQEERPQPIESYVSLVVDTLSRLCDAYGLMVPRLVFEPGRWLVGDAGITLYSIGAIKDIERVRKYVSVDGGMADNPRPALYQAMYSAVIANRPKEPTQETVTICGKCCESGDVLIKDIALPKVVPGDILAVFCTGAYNYSMASNYNRLRRPAMIMVAKGESRVIVERESFEDLIKHDRI